MRLKDKVAVVTGASDAAGAAIALGLAGEGTDLHLHELDDRSESLAKVAAEAKEAGRKVVTGIFDITHPTAKPPKSDCKPYRIDIESDRRYRTGAARMIGALDISTGGAPWQVATRNPIYANS